MSYNHQLNEQHFSKPHVYRLEWGLPNDIGENTTDGFDSGYLNWFLDGELILSFNGTTLRAAGLGKEKTLLQYHQRYPPICIDESRTKTQ